MALSKTFIDILNEVSLNIFQSNFAGLNANTQQHIKNTVNMQYKDICGMQKNWLFLNRVMSVPAWIANTDAVKTLITGTHAPTSKYNIPSVASGNTVYVGQSKANANAFPVQINSVIAYIGFLGVNRVDSTGYIMICPDKDGVADINNPYGTSAAVVLTTTPGSGALVTSGVNKVFTLSDVAVPKSCTYWIVLKVKCNSGASTLTISRVSETIDSKTLNPVSSATWATNTGMGINFTMYTYDAAYADIMTVGPGIQDIFGFYDAQERQDRNMSLYGISDRADNSAVSDDSYEVKRVNANGTWTVHFKNGSLPLSWLMEYKAIATDMLTDTSEPLIPEEYRSAITMAAIIALRGEGRGVNSGDALKIIASQYEGKIRGLRMNYLPEMSIGIDTEKEGHTPAGLVFAPGYGDKRRGRRYGRLL